MSGGRVAPIQRVLLLGTRVDIVYGGAHASSCGVVLAMMEELSDEREDTNKYRMYYGIVNANVHDCYKVLLGAKT